MKIGFMSFFKDGRISGPSQSVTSLARYIRQSGLHDCSIFTSCTTEAPFYLNGEKIKALGDAELSCGEFDVFVLCGIYDVALYKFSRRLKSLGIPYVVSARGNLMLPALNKSLFKKRLAFFLYVNRFLNDCSALHFLTHEEYENSKKIPKKIILSPNGVRAQFDPEDFNIKSNEMIFIGRLDVPHKGIDVLLESVAKLRSFLKSSGWKVKLYGPDCNGGREFIEKYLKEESIDDFVSLHSAVTGEDKWAALKKAKIFVNLSRYEGQPQAVLEAMSAGCFPIVTRWNNIEEFVVGAGGSVVEMDVSEICKSIEKYVSLSERLTSEKYFSLHEAVKSSYDWEVIAQEFSKQLEEIVA